MRRRVRIDAPVSGGDVGAKNATSQHVGAMARRRARDAVFRHGQNMSIKEGR